MKKLLSITVLLFSSIIVFAWGQTGHRVVGKIAQSHLTEKSKKALEEIMGCESLVEASTWMDNIKSDSLYDYARSWHYVTIPEGEQYEQTDKNEEGDAYESILRMIAIIGDLGKNSEERKEAVRMLVHLVGDFHQPLHVGNGEDRGGNDVKIKWFYRSSNLHRIWDSEMIDSKQLSYSELSEMIDCSRQNIPNSFYSTDLDLWVKEAVNLRPQIYSFHDPENLSYRYLYDNWETVKNQLHKAGFRLATILNGIFDA